MEVPRGRLGGGPWRVGGRAARRSRGAFYYTPASEGAAPAEHHAMGAPFLPGSVQKGPRWAHAGDRGPTRDYLGGRGTRERYKEELRGSFLYFVRSVWSYDDHSWAS